MRKYLVFLAIAVLFAFLARQISRSKNRAGAPPAHGAVSNETVQSPSPRLASLERQVGIKKRLLRRDEKNFYLDVTVHVARRCAPGDADLINLELASSDSPRLLVSVESLSGDADPKPVVNAVGPELVANGASFTYPIPLRSRGRRLGLFICKDSANQGRCLGKPYEDLNRIFAEHSRAGGKLRNPPDRIYFFQFLNLGDEENVAVLDHARFSSENAARLPEYLRETDRGGGLNTIPADARVIEEVTRAAVSLPIAFGNGLRIDLPVQDRSLCRNLPRTTRR